MQEICTSGSVWTLGSQGYFRGAGYDSWALLGARAEPHPEACDDVTLDVASPPTEEFYENAIYT
jgi:hypothetical protein